MARPDKEHYSMVAKAMLRGRVVPFLGAGANLCDRPRCEKWEPGRFLPSGQELASHLVDKIGGVPHGINDLLKVSQHIVIRAGQEPLYGELRQVFDMDYPPSAVHTFLAAVAPIVHERSGRYQLIVTTNYDDVLERTFAGLPYEVITYHISDAGEPKFIHRPHRGDAGIPIRKANTSEISTKNATVILKLHGEVDRLSAPPRDLYVITEDDYIDYLSRQDLTRFIPVHLLAMLRNDHLLFLGYGLRDWNLRVILRRIWQQRTKTARAWAIQDNVEWFEERSWSRHDVDILQENLSRYVADLQGRLAEESPAAPPPSP